MLALDSPQFAPEGRPSKEPDGNPDIVRVNADVGGNRHTLAEPSLDLIKTTEQGNGGTSAAYLAARLKKAKRDDLLEEIE